MSGPLHIVVVDDDPRIRRLLCRYLSSEKFKVSEASDGEALRAILGREPVDLVLLDVLMPGDDGLNLARRIRQNGNTPIIMVSSKGDLVDRVAALEIGADDYIAKPFHLREVLARIRTVLRRSSVAEPPAGAAVLGDNRNVFAFEDWEFDLGRRELRRIGGDLVPLSASEFDLLRVFVTNPNHVMDRNHVMDLMKGSGWAAHDRTIDTHVARLRKKIETVPKAPALIKTVRGGGYVFAAPVRPK